MNKAEQIVFDVDKQERQIFFTKFDKFMQENNNLVFRKYLAIAEYCLDKDNKITKQNGVIKYPKVKK